MVNRPNLKGEHIMDYTEDRTVEDKLADSPAQILPAKRPNPSCMREHLDHLQQETDRLTKVTVNQDQRIQKLEMLVGM